MEYIKVYDLKEDKEKISNIQNATLNTDYAGLEIEHGLLGTEEWWQAIDQKLFSKKVIKGRISRVYMSGHGGNYPEFEIENTDGKTQWTREGDDKYFIAGKRIRLTYILQKKKKPCKILGKYSETVLTIEIEP